MEFMCFLWFSLALENNVQRKPLKYCVPNKLPEGHFLFTPATASSNAFFKAAAKREEVHTNDAINI